MSHCDINDKSCSSSSTEFCKSEQEEDCCITGMIVDPPCLTEETVQKIAKAFPYATQGVMVDILKEKIRKAWGPIMEKEADAFLKATEVHWEAAFKATAASRELRESLKKIMVDASK